MIAGHDGRTAGTLSDPAMTVDDVTEMSGITDLLVGNLEVALAKPTPAAGNHAVKLAAHLHFVRSATEIALVPALEEAVGSASIRLQHDAVTGHALGALKTSTDMYQGVVGVGLLLVNATTVENGSEMTAATVKGITDPETMTVGRVAGTVAGRGQVDAKNLTAINLVLPAMTKIAIESGSQRKGAGAGVVTGAEMSGRGEDVEVVREAKVVAGATEGCKAHYLQPVYYQNSDL